MILAIATITFYLALSSCSSLAPRIVKPFVVTARFPDANGDTMLCKFIVTDSTGNLYYFISSDESYRIGDTLR